MKHLLELLKWDHVRFGALLNYLVGLVDGVEQDDEPDYTELLELLTYLKPGLKGRHQKEEQVLWQTLPQYADPAGQLVALLEALHQTVVDTGGLLESTIRAAQAGTPLPLDRLRRMSDRFVGAFREQMEIEERRLYPLVESAMPNVEWCPDDALTGDGRHRPGGTGKLETAAKSGSGQATLNSTERGANDHVS